MSKLPRRSSGFTLIELIIVMAIVAILAAIAVPSYREYVLRTNRALAKNALSDLAQRQENYYVDHKGYAIDIGRLGFGGIGVKVAYLTSDGSISTVKAGAKYALKVEAGTFSTASMKSCGAATAETVRGYVLTATPVNDAAKKPEDIDPSCKALCISHTGEKGSTKSAEAAAQCWAR